MKSKKGNEGFVCERCGTTVLPLTNGSYRNHCPECLYSKHVDINPGDRLNKCQGLMKPVGIKYKSGKGYQIIHKCLRCGDKQVNIVAINTVQSDSFEKIIKISNLV